MVTDQPRPQTYRGFQAGARLRWRTPVITDAAVTGSWATAGCRPSSCAAADGATREIACDTVVFTGDWIPDHELARSGGVALDPGTRGPAVDGLLRTSVPGVFAVGNLVHPVETADVAALRASRTAAAVLDHLRGEGVDTVPDRPRGRGGAAVLGVAEPLAARRARRVGRAVDGLVADVRRAPDRPGRAGRSDARRAPAASDAGPEPPARGRRRVGVRRRPRGRGRSAVSVVLTVVGRRSTSWRWCQRRWESPPVPRRDPG